MSKNKKKSRYRVHYSICVNGTRHEKDYPLDAHDEKEAEKLLRQKMTISPDSEFEFHSAQLIS